MQKKYQISGLVKLVANHFRHTSDFIGGRLVQVIFKDTPPDPRLMAHGSD